jgi:ribosomal protein S8
MVKTSVLNDCLNAINNAEKAGKRQVMIRPSSKVIVKFLTVMQRHGTSQSYAHVAHFFDSFLLPFFYPPAHLPPSFGLITRQ